MGSDEQRCKLTSHLSLSTSPSCSSSATTAAVGPPVEFRCPISRSVMADPVVVAATGWTFERRCVEACADLGVAPPDLSRNQPFSSPSSSSSPLVLIPNIILKSAIHDWCDRHGIPRPLPVPADAARAFVRCLMPSTSSASPPLYVGVDGQGEALEAPERKDEVLREKAFSCGGDDGKGLLLQASAFSDETNKEEDDTVRSKSSGLDGNSEETTSPGVRLSSVLRTEDKSFSLSRPSTSSPTLHPTSSSSSSEIAVLPPPNVVSSVSEIETDAWEEEVLTKWMDSDVKEQEFAAASLRHATKESRDCRIKLCSPRLLASLRSILLTRCTAVQINAVAAMVNLSLEKENKVRIVRCGAVLPLVEVLKGGHPEAREHAAAALHSLALEGENRVAISSLGAIPPLLNLFASPSAAGARARRDAGKALYHLSVAGPNRPKIARTAGAVRALLAVAEAEAVVSVASSQHQGPVLARLAMMVISNLAACGDGKSALMDAGAASAVAALMRGAARATVEEYCVAALYGMSGDRLRFPRLARAAGVEKVLMSVVEGNSGDIRREMAKKTLRAIKRGEEAEATPLRGYPAEDDGNLVSDGLMSFRRRNKVVGNGTSPF
ncbi:hypothetical protein BHE74_00059039 [Ensete ventricosum]|nr:hypothetical protein BHE74_00059039 [Ensete ventricosum]